MTQHHKYRLLSEENQKSLADYFWHMTIELFRNEAQNFRKGSGSRYSEEMKEFAISLHVYSPRASRLIRKSLNLPHSATIRSWSINSDCEPGFLKKTFEYSRGSRGAEGLCTNA